MTILEQNAYNAIISMAKKDEPDYWTRLEHTYAGMAMQGILSNNELYREICKSRNLEITIMEYAHALVEKLKNSNIEKEQ